jgi:hypothetical protein
MPLDQYRETIDPYRDCPGRRGRIEPDHCGRGSFDRAVWSKSLVFATDAVIPLWDFNGRQLARLEFARAVGDGLGGEVSGSVAKCVAVV